MAMFSLGAVFAFVNGKVESKGWLSKAVTRKLFNSIGMYGPGAALIWLAFVGCDRISAVVALTLAVGLNAGVQLGFQNNFNDIAPNYSGTLYAISNTIAQAWGFVSPFVTGEVTNGNVSYCILLLAMKT